MLIPTILSTLEKLATLHEYLYEVTVRKADIVKNNRLEDLQELTKEEKKYTQAIAQLEKQRAQLSGSRTISELAEEATEEEKVALHHLKERLTETIQSIQQQNELNQLLLQQSLQFVTVTMNALNPEPNAINYEKSANVKKNTNAPTRSMFDSKA
ncbi:flagellar export chaperone FlgN [Sutcliffiella deserti]|uniref:flagellar export chaperone FlgN n=1 Tax=Sutcliffiella deserti TaxID=2875501 RepID=UPI001CBEADD4|nr:flagellar export chaperone FlgN [Sutcliffiella deserti]